MNVIETKLPGCVVIEPAVFGDERPSRLRNLHAAILGVVLR